MLQQDFHILLLDVEAALGIVGIASVGLLRSCIRKSFSSFFLLSLSFVETAYICVSRRSQHMETVLAPTLKNWGWLPGNLSK